MQWGRSDRYCPLIRLQPTPAGAVICFSMGCFKTATGGMEMWGLLQFVGAIFIAGKWGKVASAALTPDVWLADATAHMFSSGNLWFAQY